MTNRKIEKTRDDRGKVQVKLGGDLTGREK